MIDDGRFRKGQHPLIGAIILSIIDLIYMIYNVVQYSKDATTDYDIIGIKLGIQLVLPFILCFLAAIIVAVFAFYKYSKPLAFVAGLLYFVSIILHTDALVDMLVFGALCIIASFVMEKE